MTKQKFKPDPSATGYLVAERGTNNNLLRDTMRFFPDLYDAISYIASNYQDKRLSIAYHWRVYELFTDQSPKRIHGTIIQEAVLKQRGATDEMGSTI